MKKIEMLGIHNHCRFAVVLIDKGHRCGYVAVAPHVELWRAGAHVDCPSGTSFEGDLKDDSGRVLIRHAIGFDLHRQMAPDILALHRAGMEVPRVDWTDRRPIWTTAQVAAVCRDMIDQLKEWEEAL